MSDDLCIYRPGETILYAFIYPGTPQSQISEWLDYYGGQVMPYSEAEKLIAVAEAEKYDTQPKRITSDRYDDMLNVLPPMKWERRGYTESFMLSERLTDNYAIIFCRVDDQFFEFSGPVTMTHGGIVARCKPAE